MSNFLSPQIRSELLLRHKNERDKRVCDRIKVILLRDEGWAYEEIAHALLLSHEGIRKQVEDYLERNKLKPENGGSETMLNELQTNELATHLEQNTYIKVKEIVDYVKTAYDVKYSISGMTNWLKSQNFSYHKPAVVPAKANKERQKQWLEAYNKMRNHLPEEDHIVFFDGVHPSHEVRVVRGWIKKGQRKEIPTNGGQRRINIIGALNLETMSLFTKEYDTINAGSTTDFFDYLQKSIPTVFINIVLDQARYNTCNVVKDYASNNPRIKLHYLPPYSPNLNAIEPCWKIMHEHVTNNQYYAHFKDFTEAIHKFFNTTFSEYASQWVDRLTDNFRILHSPLNPNS